MFRLMLLLLLLFVGCGKDMADGNGSASETIAIVINDSSISGTISIEEGAPLRVSFYPYDYVPPEVGITSTKGIETITVVDTHFISNEITGGVYNLLIEDTQRGAMAFVDSIAIGRAATDTIKVELIEPVELWGRITHKSDFLSYIIAVGTPFYTDVNSENGFYFPVLPTGKHRFASVEEVLFDNGPSEITLFPLVSNDADIIQIDSKIDSLIVQPQ